MRKNLYAKGVLKRGHHKYSHTTLETKEEKEFEGISHKVKMHWLISEIILKYSVTSSQVAQKELELITLSGNYASKLIHPHFYLFLLKIFQQTENNSALKTNNTNCYMTD